MKLYHTNKEKKTCSDLYQINLQEAHLYAKNGLMALSLTVGMKVLDAMMQHEISEIAGKKGKHNKGRDWYRHGTEDTSVVLGVAPTFGEITPTFYLEYGCDFTVSYTIFKLS